MFEFPKMKLGSFHVVNTFYDAAISRIYFAFVFCVLWLEGQMSGVSELVNLKKDLTQQTYQ